MSKQLHNTKPAQHDEHGTTRAYIIGFILSLVFTIIPYYLVVNKVISGNTLLAAILGIAVLQMIIQLVFFLHLGRGPKPLYNIVFFFATAGVIVVTIGASLFIMNNLYRNMSPQEIVLKQAQKENIAQIGGKDTGACNELRQNQVVIISDGVASPVATQANRCDTLTFINQDTRDYKLVFSTLENVDVSYGGEDSVVVSSGDSEIITLNEVGNFGFRDYIDSSPAGMFTVSP